MNKHEFVTVDQLISLYLLYNKIPWAAVIETTNTDYREALDEFMKRAGLNVEQIPDEEVDCKTLIITGPEAVLRQLVLETKVYEDPADTVYVDLWHGGRSVLSNLQE